MKTIRTLASLGLALTLIFAFTARAELLAGAAKADITPNVQEHKIPSSGYGARGRQPMQGVHDPVMAKALVLKSGDFSVAIVTLDLIGVSRELRRAVLERLQGAGINDQNLLITASHTHSGPGAMEKNFIAGLVFGGYQKWLTEWTADQIAGAVKEAQSGLKPAKLKAASGLAPGLTKNRRDPAKSYNYDTRRFNNAYDPRNPANVTDDEIIVLRVDDALDQPLAILVSFATHGTVLGADNMLISADWPGAMQRELETAFPGTVVLYMNGAQGDQAPAMPDNPDDLACMEIIGKNVAQAALPLAQNALPIPAEPVAAVLVRREIDVPVRAMGVHIPKLLFKHWYPSMPLAGVRAGDVIFLAVPLEMISEIGLTMKQGAKGIGYPVPIIAGLANGLFLYLTTPDEYDEGGYEAGNTVYGKIEAGLVIGEEMMIARKLRKQ